MARRKASARSQPLSPEASHTSVPSGQTSARRVGRGPSALSREDAIAEEDEEAIYDAIERAIQSAVGRSNDSLSDVLGASRSELGAEVSQLSLAETDKAAIDEVRCFAGRRLCGGSRFRGTVALVLQQSRGWPL